MRSKEHWIRKDKLYLRRNWGTLTDEAMAKALGRTPKAVALQRRKMGLKIPKSFNQRAATEASRSSPHRRKQLAMSWDGRGGYKVRWWEDGVQYCSTYGRWYFRSIGRPLQHGEVVIYKDGNKRNTDPSNLCIVQQAEVSRKCLGRHIGTYHPRRPVDKWHSKDAFDPKEQDWL